MSRLKRKTGKREKISNVKLKKGDQKRRKKRSKKKEGEGG